jgi:hypothetical protein
MLHDLLLSLKLARHYKGALHVTKLGKQLRGHPGELWALIAKRILGGFDATPYSRFEVPFVGNWDVFLNIINVEGHMGCTDDHLCAVLFGSKKGEHGLEHAKIRSAFYVHCLRPLIWLGLLDETTTGTGLNRERIFTKTPLWFSVFRLETNALIAERLVH